MGVDNNEEFNSDCDNKATIAYTHKLPATKQCTGTRVKKTRSKAGKSAKKKSEKSDDKQVNKSDSFDCSHCDKTFTTNRKLKSHLYDLFKRQRQVKSPITCNVCDKTFASSGSLSLHKRIHDDIRPYQCNVCQKSFRQKVALQRHEPIHMSLREISEIQKEEIYDFSNSA